jgi:hypothetical protein
MTEMPRCDNNIGPVMSNTAMANQTTGRNRSAADRNSAMNSGAAFRALTNGAKTRDRKIMPPIQLTAARMCRITRVEYMPHHNQSQRTTAMPHSPIQSTVSSSFSRDSTAGTVFPTIDSCPRFSPQRGTKGLCQRKSMDHAYRLALDQRRRFAPPEHRRFWLPFS